MYKNTKTWNPFKGCRFDCIYCENSFKRQAKRQKQNCIKCYNYEPHFHPERLKKIPKADLIFACGNGDIAFASRVELACILKEMQLHPKKTFLLQTKAPQFLNGWRIPSNVIIGTTIETNRNTNHISKAPITERRYRGLRNLDCCRKSVTIEPILKFDLGVLREWIWNINPEIVWVGYANHITGLNLDEPTLKETKQLITALHYFTDVRLKTIRVPIPPNTKELGILGGIL
jgi:hypothetical protein